MLSESLKSVPIEEGLMQLYATSGYFEDSPRFPTIDHLVCECLQPGCEVEKSINVVLKDNTIPVTDPVLERVLKTYGSEGYRLDNDEELRGWVKDIIRGCVLDVAAFEEEALKPFHLPERVAPKNIAACVYLSRWGGTYTKPFGGKKDYYQEDQTYGQEHEGVDGFANVMTSLTLNHSMGGLSLPSDIADTYMVAMYRQRIKASGIQMIYAGLPDSETADVRQGLADPQSILPEERITFLTKGNNTISQLEELKDHLHCQPNNDRNRILLVTTPGHGMRILRMMKQIDVIPERFHLDVVFAGIPHNKDYQRLVRINEIKAVLAYHIRGIAAKTLTPYTLCGNIDMV